MNKATEGKHLSKLRFNAVDVLIVALLAPVFSRMSL